MELKKRSDLHLSRKIWHVMTGVSALSATYLLKFNSKQAAIVSGSIAIIGLIVEMLRLNNQKINNIFLKYMGSLLRDTEKNKMSGLVYYALGVSITFSIFPWHLAIMGILILIFADPLASLIGTKFGKRKIINGKSVEGFLGCWIVCCLTIYGYSYFTQLNISLVFILLGGFLGALSELFVILDDNLSIPILSGLFFYLIAKFITYDFLLLTT